MATFYNIDTRKRFREMYFPRKNFICHAISSVNIVTEKNQSLFARSTTQKVHLNKLLFKKENFSFNEPTCSCDISSLTVES
jgi:hypothetical protein